MTTHLHSDLRAEPDVNHITTPLPPSTLPTNHPCSPTINNEMMFLDPFDSNDEISEPQLLNEEVLKQIRARMALLEGEPAPTSDEQFYDMHFGTGLHPFFRGPRVDEEREAGAAVDVTQERYDENYPSAASNQESYDENYPSAAFDETLEWSQREMECGPNCVCNGIWACDNLSSSQAPREPGVPRTKDEIAEHERISLGYFLNAGVGAGSASQRAIPTQVPDIVMSERDQATGNLEVPTNPLPQRAIPAQVPDIVMSERGQAIGNLEVPTDPLPQQHPSSQAQNQTVNQEEDARAEGPAPGKKKRAKRASNNWSSRKRKGRKK
ncbi:hypothetical protein B7494_g5740 [Chlorociboria aeruginascens]|nr:hypothetical protein B7494_g5740 [Chlorociboria aeruginascens]